MDSEKVKIDISTSTLVRFFLLALFIWLLFTLRGVIAVLLTAVVIASSVDPAARWFMQYRIPRVLGVLFIYLSTFSALGFVFYLVAPPLISDLGAFLTELPEHISSFEPTNILSFLPQLPTGLTIVLRDAIMNLDVENLGSANGFFSAVSGIFGGAISFILIIVISFYLSVEEKGIENFLKIAIPKEYEGYAIDLWERSRRKIGFWLQGQLLLGVLIGILVFLGLTIVGVKYALLLALLAGILEIIPVFGPIIAAIPAIGVGFLGSPMLGLSTLILFVIVQQFENHLIYPLVIRKTIGIPPILVILSLFIGSTLAGFFGILLAVPVATVLMEFINDFARKRQIEF